MHGENQLIMNSSMLACRESDCTDLLAMLQHYLPNVSVYQNTSAKSRESRSVPKTIFG